MKSGPIGGGVPRLSRRNGGALEEILDKGNSPQLRLLLMRASPTRRSFFMLPESSCR